LVPSLTPSLWPSWIIIDGSDDSSSIDGELGTEEGPHQMLDGFLVALVGRTWIFKKAQQIINFFTPIGVKGTNVLVNGFSIDR
jgi:hypothetical protein